MSDRKRRRRAEERRAIAHRQSLFGNPPKQKTKMQRYLDSLPAKHWYRINDPVLREELRREYQRLLQPPPVEWRPVGRLKSLDQKEEKNGENSSLC